MSMDHKTLRGAFNEMMSVKQDITNQMETLKRKQEFIVKLYQKIKSENTASKFQFGLDTLHFQHLLLTREIAHLNDSICIINNRVYGDYYKLYGLVKQFIHTHPRLLVYFTQNSEFNKYTVYKDLDIKKQYDDNLISDLYFDIVSINGLMKSHIDKLDEKLEDYQEKLSFGLDIDNFVFTVQDANLEIANKLDLFDKYLFYLSGRHKKYLDSCLKKINRFIGDLNQDLHLEKKDRDPDLGGESGRALDDKKN